MTIETNTLDDFTTVSFTSPISSGVGQYTLTFESYDRNSPVAPGSTLKSDQIVLCVVDDITIETMNHQIGSADYHYAGLYSHLQACVSNHARTFVSKLVTVTDFSIVDYDSTSDQLWIRKTDDLSLEGLTAEFRLIYSL